MQTSPPSTGASILIVDDDPGQRSLLDAFLRAQGFTTLLAESGPRALALLGSQPVSLMVSDVRMPGMSGLELFHLARKEHEALPVLLVTAYADIRDAVGAMRDGALNYLAKPVDLDELLASVQHAVGIAAGPGVQYGDRRPLPAHILAESPLMQSVFHDAALIAPSESRVLITGESGVGKEMIVDVIHAWSQRAGGPLVKVNCAAIPETLLESELFGHEKGAFTGAYTQRIGRFEQASDGTIFLDEIGDMSPTLQAKLLRVTQDGRFQRLGSNTEIHTNARIVAATNRNLEEDVRAGRFRQDLFYRLNVVDLSIPPLRERPEDILPLANYFLSDLSQGRARLAPAAGETLRRYNWPGNVRELRNAIERAALLSRGELILPEHLPARVRAPQNAAPSVSIGTEARLEAIEREAILVALRKHDFNRSEAAKALGISRRGLIYKIQQLRAMGFRVDREDPAPEPGEALVGSKPAD